MMTDNERFFKFFDYLKEKGKISTLVQLADVIGTNKSGVNDLKTGKKKISIDNIRSVKKAYPEISLEWVILEEGEMIKTEQGQSRSSDQSDLLKEIILLQKQVIGLQNEVNTHNKSKKTSANDPVRGVERQLK